MGSVRMMSAEGTNLQILFDSRKSESKCNAVRRQTDRSPAQCRDD